MIGILLVSSTKSIAFLLVIPLLVIIHWGTIIVMFVPFLSIILIVRLPIILLLQLSFQLVVLLSEPFNRCGKGLHLSRQCVGLVFGLLVGGGHWSCQTIQLFVFEMVIWFITHPHRWHQLMMHKNCQGVDRPQTCLWMYLKNKREEPIKGDWWNTS